MSLLEGLSTLPPEMVDGLSVEEAEAVLTQLAAVFFVEPELNHEKKYPAAKPLPVPTVRMAEARYRTLIEQIPVVTFMAMLDGGLNETYVSPQIETMLGYTQEEWLENPVLWYRRLHADDKARWNAEFSQVVTTGAPFDSVYRFIAKDGHTVWIRGEGKIVRDEDGVPLFIQGVGFDITEIKVAEEAVRKSNELFRALARVSPVGIFRTDDAGQYVYVNERWCEISGLSADETLGAGWAKAVHPEDSIRVIAGWAHAVREGATFAMEYRLRRNSDSVAWVYVQTAAERDSRGRVIGYIGSVTDITERKAAEIKIHDSLKEKEVLLKEIHHRVKNNLQISAGLFSLQSATVTDERIKDVFRESENRIKSMALVHEMLYQSTNLAHIDVGAYIENLAPNMLRSYGSRTARIALHLEFQKVFLDIDKATPFGLIVNELIGNCVKHAFLPGAPGDIWVEIKAENGLLLLVADNGCGFPKGFDYKLSKTLGLKLINTLTKQLKGTLELIAIAGRTEFRLKFPI